MGKPLSDSALVVGALAGVSVLLIGGIMFVARKRDEPAPAPAVPGLGNLSSLQGLLPGLISPLAVPGNLPIPKAPVPIPKAPVPMVPGMINPLFIVSVQGAGVVKSPGELVTAPTDKPLSVSHISIPVGVVLYISGIMPGAKNGAAPKGYANVTLPKAAAEVLMGGPTHPGGLPPPAVQGDAHGLFPLHLMEAQWVEKKQPNV